MNFLKAAVLDKQDLLYNVQCVQAVNYCYEVQFCSGIKKVIDSIFYENLDLEYNTIFRKNILNTDRY